MFLPDTPTLLLTDIILNVTCGLMCFVWLHLRGERQFSYWGSGFLACSASSAISAFTSVIPAFTIVQSFGVGLGIGLYWAGYRVFDGRSPTTVPIAALAMAPGVLTLSMSIIVGGDVAPALAGFAAFIVVIAAFARYVIRPFDAGMSQPTERKIGGWAMAPLAIALVFSIALQFHRPDTQMGGFIVLLTDHAVTVTFAVSMFAMSVERAYRRIEDLARRDPLTGVLNRAGLAATTSALPAPAGVLIADLDHFKSVNDRYGHPAGDEVLREFARRTVHCLADDAIVARMGGEEFLAVIPNADLAALAKAAQDLRHNLREKPVSWAGETISVTVSVGIATLAPGEDLDLVVARADAALYRAKSGGRDRVAA